MAQDFSLLFIFIQSSNLKRKFWLLPPTCKINDHTAQYYFNSFTLVFKVIQFFPYNIQFLCSFSASTLFSHFLSSADSITILLMTLYKCKIVNKISLQTRGFLLTQSVSFSTNCYFPCCQFFISFVILVLIFIFAGGTHDSIVQISKTGRSNALHLICLEK